jgi:hypothetical protein
MLKTRLTLAPGQNGTKKLLRRFGQRLICVRYRYDEAAKRRFKTVELVVDEIPWEKTVRPDPTVEIRLAVEEVALRQLVKDAGGRWRPEKKVWELPFSEVKRLRLQHRMTSKKPSDVDGQR